MSELVVRDSVQGARVVKDFLEIGECGEDGFMGVGCDGSVWVTDYDIGVFALSGVFVKLEVDVGSCDRGWSRWIVAMFPLRWEGIFPVLCGIGHCVKGRGGSCSLKDENIPCS